MRLITSNLHYLNLAGSRTGLPCREWTKSISSSSSTRSRVNGGDWDRRIICLDSEIGGLDVVTVNFCTVSFVASYSRFNRDRFVRPPPSSYPVCLFRTNTASSLVYVRYFFLSSIVCWCCILIRVRWARCYSFSVCFWVGWRSFFVLTAVRYSVSCTHFSVLSLSFCSRTRIYWSW